MAETAIGPPPLCPGVGQFAPMSDTVFHGVCIECGGYAFLMPDGTAGAHWWGGVDPANPVCNHRGPRIANAGSPLCVRPQTDGHGDGEHMAHESWGVVTW